MSKETIQVKRNEVKKHMIVSIFSEMKDSRSSKQNEGRVTGRAFEQSENSSIKKKNINTVRRKAKGYNLRTPNSKFNSYYSTSFQTM